MKQFGLFLVLLLVLPLILVLSCETVPTPSELEFLLDLLDANDLISLAPLPETTAPSEEPPSVGLPSAVQTAEEPVFAGQAFDPSNISNDLYETTKAEIQGIIQKLDSIIRARNYNEWLEYLSEPYMGEISSPEFLEARTEELYRRDQLVAAATGKNPRTVEKKVLGTLKDYFDNVVVPSRANDRVDDIDFFSETKIRAYTVNNRGTRLILYDLEIIGGTWKIIG